MTKEQREILVRLRDRYRSTAGVLRDVGGDAAGRSAALYEQEAAALDAALRELDELSGLVRHFARTLAACQTQSDWRAWVRLCELLPGLAASAEGGTT